MERALHERMPEQRNDRNLSKISKIFFGVDIFQVIVAVVFQGYMLLQGNFEKYREIENPEGMGPGRRVYMGLYMGAIVYTCFLCLFAVKQKNFMEVLAFVLQNFLFVSYSGIQVYQVGFKTNNSGFTTPLTRIALANAVVLFVLNIVFIYLAYKLYSEFGWKIYKKVRFDMKLRGVYQVYELLLCLLKMEMLYYWMYAICHALVLLRDNSLALYYVSLSLIPLSVLHIAIGLIATRREIRSLMLFFLLWSLGVCGYFLYKLFGFLTRTCTGCASLLKNGEDIPSEAFMHFVYLASTNLVVILLVFAVALKAYLNFGKGLANHFHPKVKRGASGHNLSLRRPSSVEESVTSVVSCDSMFEESGEFKAGNLHPPPSAVPLLAKATLQNLIERRSNSLPNLENATSSLLNPSTGRQNSMEKPLSKLTRISEDVAARSHDGTDRKTSGKRKPEDIRIANSSTGEPGSAGVCNGSNSVKLHVNGNVQIHAHNGAVSKETGYERTNCKPVSCLKKAGLESREPDLGGDKLNSNRRGSNEWLDSGIWVNSGNDKSSADNEQVVLYLPAASPNDGERPEIKSRGTAGCTSTESRAV